MRNRFEPEGKSLAPRAFFHTITDSKLEKTLDDICEIGALFPTSAANKQERRVLDEAEQETLAEMKRTVKAHNQAHDEERKRSEEVDALIRVSSKAQTNPLICARSTAKGISPESVVQGVLDEAKQQLSIAQDGIIETNKALIFDLQEWHVFG